MNNIYKNLVWYITKKNGYSFLLIFLILISYTTQVFADYNLTEAILLRAFPGSLIKKEVNLFGTQDTDNVLVKISLRNKKGFIPFSKTRTIQFNDSIAVVAFEIFLFTENKPVDEIITRSIQNNPENGKLLQLLFFNPKELFIYGKPSGFPIEAESWLCSGDFCDIAQIRTLEKIHSDNPSCAFHFSLSANKQSMQVFLFQNGIIKNSDIRLVGDLSGETGNEILVEYGDLRESKGCITAIKKTICIGNSEICEIEGFIAGKKEFKDTLIGCK